jgi:HSP20 family molecular chaperone IbpA
MTEVKSMNHDIEAKPKQKVDRPDETTRPGLYFQPAVDILETPDALVVLTDMPGVTPEGLNVGLEGDVLTIEGRPQSNEYEGLKPLHVEYNVGGFHRRFTIGEAVDRDGIKAELKNGVLRLLLPKAERAKARRIEVRAS